MGSKTATKKPKPADAPAPAGSAVGRTPAPAPKPWERPPHPPAVDGTVAADTIRVRSNYAGDALDPEGSPDDAAFLESVRTHGVLQNLLLRPVGAGGKDAAFVGGEWVGLDHFEVVFGHRRLAAAKLAGQSHVKARVQWLTDEEVLALQLVENDQRRPPKPSRQAAAYADLAASGWTLERICATTGKTAGFVRACLALSKLPSWALAAVDAGTLPRSTAEHVARVPGEESRRKAAACALLGFHDPDLLDSTLNDGDGWEDEVKAIAGGLRPNADTPLSQRETKELIRTHLQRQLKGAPFSLKVLYTPPGAEPGGEAALPACDLCPKRAGNDAEAQAEGVRPDVCLDPDCFGRKVEAYRETERTKFRKRFKLDADADVNPDGAELRDSRASDNQMPANGWCDWSGPILLSDLNQGPEFPLAWKKYTKDTKVSEVVLACPIVHGCRPNLVFDAKDRPRVLVRTSEARKTLTAAGILKKLEPRKRETKPARSETIGTDRQQSAPSGETKPAAPSDWDVSGRAAEIAGKVIQEHAADLLDGELVDMAPTLKPALVLLTRFLVWDHVKFGQERLALVNGIFRGDSSTAAGMRLTVEFLKGMTAAELLAAALRLAAVPTLLDQQPTPESFQAAWLDFAELDWDHLRDQARRELAGGETADEKIDRAEAAMEAEPAAEPVPLADINVPEDVADILAARPIPITTAGAAWNCCQVEMADVPGLPPRNLLVAWLVRLGAKLKSAENAAKAIADHIPAVVEGPAPNAAAYNAFIDCLKASSDRYFADPDLLAQAAAAWGGPCNDSGVIEKHNEGVLVAKAGKASAELFFAYNARGLHLVAGRLETAMGGSSGPLSVWHTAYDSREEARRAGLEALLKSAENHSQGSGHAASVEQAGKLAKAIRAALNDKPKGGAR